MPKFRKKPVVIEAVQYDQRAHEHFWFSEDGWDECPGWLQAASDKPMSEPGSFFLASDLATIRTLEGDHHVSIGDWIIQGVAGELYPCKPDIFAATYDEVL